MPNWTYNHITIKKNECDAELWALIQKAAEDASDSAKKVDFMQSIFPCPQELLDTTSGYVGGADKEAHEAKEQRNLDKYGVKNWYDWKVSRWGTKWDICDYDLNYVNDEEVSISGNTAWCFPEGFLNFLVEKGCDVENYFTNEDYDGEHFFQNGEITTKHYVVEVKVPYETNKELIDDQTYELKDNVFVRELEVKSLIELAQELVNSNLLPPETLTSIMNNKDFDYGEYDKIGGAFLQCVYEEYNSDDGIDALMCDLNDCSDPNQFSITFKYEEYL